MGRAPGRGESGTRRAGSASRRNAAARSRGRDDPCRRGARSVPQRPVPADGAAGRRHAGHRTRPLAASLARRLSRRPTARLVDGLDLALVLVADHGLAASTLAARVAANTRAPIYSSVQAAVAALQGPRHCFATPWAEERLAEVATGRSVDVVVEEHLRRGESLWYSGYEAGGDPRAEFLLEETLRLASPTRTRTITKLLRFAETHAMPPAGAEFAFAAFAHGFGLVRGGGQAIFAVGRTAGWVAHAIEEHASPSPLRMRAAYVGPDPADPE